MSDPDSTDLPATEPLDTDSSDASPESSSGPGQADNSGATEANQPDPDLKLIEPAAD